MADTDQERTEQATPKKRQDARKKGQVAKSQDLVAAASLLGATLLFVASADGAADYAGTILGDSLSTPFALQTDVSTFASFLSEKIFQVLGKLILFFLVVITTSVAANMLQTGFLFLPDKLIPKLSRIDPMKNFARIFSIESFGQILFGLLKTIIVVAILAFAVRRDLETLVSLPNGSPLQLALFFGAYMKRLVFLLCGALLTIGALDYAVKRFKHERELRMTQQELRDEIKEETGNQQIKGKRRAMRRSALGSISAVPTAPPASPVARYQNAEKEPNDRRQGQTK